LPAKKIASEKERLPAKYAKGRERKSKSFLHFAFFRVFRGQFLFRVFRGQISFRVFLV